METKSNSTGRSASAPVALARVDLHAGYNAARQKLAELESARSATRTELAKAQRAQEQAEKPDARLKWRIKELSGALEGIEAEYRAQEAEVERQRQNARAEVLAGLRPELAAIERSYFLELIALAKTIEARDAWLKKATDAGIPTHEGRRVFWPACLDNPSDPNSMTAAMLAGAVKRGAIRADEIPAARREAQTLRPRPQLAAVRFLHRAAAPFDAYMPGESAAFPIAQAELLIEAGVAEPQ